jgi:predicted amidophosphoribosyltransferase
MKESKLCKQCGLELYGMEREGDICLRCLQSIRYHENTYSTIEGCIRQSTNNPLKETDEKDTNEKDQGSSL